jgi:large-conductance mechanosensitive channel
MIKELIDLLSKNTILFAISIAVISAFANQLLFSFINDIILPVIDRDGNSDNDPDINKLNNFVIKFFGITFKVGAFIIALIRFILLLFILFIIGLILIKLNKN